MKQAIIYTRFSPRRNADESESCEVQRDYCERYARENELTVLSVFDDPDVSGADEFRPKLWEAIDSLPKDGVLLVYKRDRLARNVYLAEQIERAVRAKGAAIAAVSGDVQGNGPEQVMIRQIVAAMAEYERKLIGQRTSHAMRHHQATGRRMGRFAPYGWEIDPSDETRIVPCEREERAVRRIYELAENETDTLAIAQSMNAEMPELARGTRKWTRKSIESILRRKR
jgi:site-specific DNA recombinase